VVDDAGEIRVLVVDAQGEKVGHRYNYASRFCKR
jgi:hypothetical protein